MAVACLKREGLVADATLVELLRESVENSNVVDFEVEKINRRHIDARDVMPDKCLALALQDTKQRGDVIGCYITLIVEEPETMSTVNYRAGLSRTEEIAYRQVGVQEAIESWKENG